MYAIFSIERNISDLQSIKGSLSLLLFTDPEQLDLKLSGDARNSKRLDLLFQALSYETPIAKLAMFTLPACADNPDVHAVISQIPGYVGLVEEGFNRVFPVSLKQRVGFYQAVRMIRRQLLSYRNNLQPVFFALSINSPIPLTPQEHHDFSSTVDRTLEQQREIAEEFYLRIYTTYVTCARSYLVAPAKAGYTDPKLEPPNWNSAEDATAECSIFSQYFTTIPSRDNSVSCSE